MPNSLKYIFLLSVLFIGCARTPIFQSKNIPYDLEHQLSLNVFSPKNNKVPKEVLVFIHGGNFDKGKKSIYNFFGKGMARKGIVTVIIDYRLHPTADNEDMATDAATAIKWTVKNINCYGGDPNKIFVSGHSAGGQIAALIATDNQYFEKLNISNPIKGAIMIDAFGLNMYNYLQQNLKYNRKVYLSVFSDNPENWKKLSPSFLLHPGTPPFLLFIGAKTYPNIVNGNNEFYSELKRYQPSAQMIKVKNERHVDMIFSFYNSHKKAYNEMIDFMKNPNGAVNTRR